MGIIGKTARKRGTLRPTRSQSSDRIARSQTSLGMYRLPLPMPTSGIARPSTALRRGIDLMRDLSPPHFTLVTVRATLANPEIAFGH